MRKFIFLSAVALNCLALPGFAEDYVCEAKANSNRGFPTAFSIKISPAAVGGSVDLIIDSKSKPLGTVSESTDLINNNSTQQPAFNLTLQLIGEEDVSGLNADDLAKVSRIYIFKVAASSQKEISVYQLFSGPGGQTGGTFFVDGMATNCSVVK